MSVERRFTSRFSEDCSGTLRAIFPRLLILHLLVSALWSGLPAGEEKPNVILILVDDLGWQDVKCYDIDEPSPMETPNLDALADKGVLFWQGYSPSPVCAPSRAAILSGLHPARSEMTSVGGGTPPHAGRPEAAKIAPFNTARMPLETYSLAEAMKAEGYVTAHSGKWHISKNHYDYPTPYYHGFDQSTHHRGVQDYMKPDRLTGFATTDPKDPYRLDANGFPFDVPQDAALSFIRENRDKPFFLYYATWLVHTPIVMRSEALLRKYEQKLGVTITEAHKKAWNQPGQTNPFYCAMVEQLDYYLGQIFQYLEATDDPRRPGHKLIDNTYIIFSSDNGGMEGPPGAIFTDNYPLHRGKISVHEGGTRVPLIITGPDIPANVQTEVMANGLDFYPTILSLIQAEKPANQIFDGCDLAPLLRTDPTDATLVRDSSGQVRDTMMWHFPQMENTSSIRVNDYKLVRRYGPGEPSLSLYQLYRSEGGKTVRVDLEEAHDLAAQMPEKTAELDALLSTKIKEKGGRIPYGNPTSTANLPHQDKAPEILKHVQKANAVGIYYRNNGADLAYADLIYSPNNGREWLRVSGEPIAGDRVRFELPIGTTHYFVNLVDENNFMAIYPTIDRPKMKQEGLEMVDVAVFAGYPEPTAGVSFDREAIFKQRTAPRDGQTFLAAFDFGKDGLTGLDTYGDGEGLVLTDDGDGPQGQCLSLQELESLKHKWMPLLSVPLSFPEVPAAGLYRASLDLKLDEEAPGSIRVTVLRDRVEAGRVSFGPEDVKVGDRNLAELEPGLWYHLEVSGRFGAGRDRQLSVSLAAEDGRIWNARVPYTKYHFDRPGAVQIIGLGAPGTAVQIDNLVFTVEP